MKSRPDILEELDIKCGQWSSSRSPPRHPSQILDNMVNGGRLYFISAVAFATIINVPQTYSLDKQLKKYIYNNNGFGTYSFEFETSDGTYRREDGGIMTRGRGRILVVRGEYGYVDPRGAKYSLRYVADENGYQPQTDDDDNRFNDRRIV